MPNPSSFHLFFPTALPTSFFPGPETYSWEEAVSQKERINGGKLSNTSYLPTLSTLDCSSSPILQEFGGGLILKGQVCFSYTADST